MKTSQYFMQDAEPPYKLIHLTFINTTFAGIPIQQTWSALYMLGKFIEEEQIKLIFELGAGKGGLWKFFNNYCDTWGFDIIQDPKYDVFGQNVIARVEGEINSNRKALIFCDNGDKPRELDLYAQFLKKGDHILVHDYRRPDGVTHSDALHAIEKYDLEFYRQHEFDDLFTYILSLRKI